MARAKARIGARARAKRIGARLGLGLGIPLEGLTHPPIHITYCFPPCLGNPSGQTREHPPGIQPLQEEEKRRDISFCNHPCEVIVERNTMYFNTHKVTEDEIQGVPTN